jgi:hypothetical protein
MAASARVPHLSVDERRAKGRRRATAHLRPATPDGYRPPNAPTRWPCSRSRTPPASPTWSRSGTGGCWSRRSPSTETRPRSWPPTWPPRPPPPWRSAVRRRPPVELRPVRLARASAAVRPERFRRDPARAVRVRRQAAGGQLHHRRPQQRLHQGRHARGDAGVGCRLPRGNGQLRRHGDDGHLVRPLGRGQAPQGGPERRRQGIQGLQEGGKAAKAAKQAERTAHKSAAKAHTRDSLQTYAEC